jgi:hypothetical protein
MGREWSWHFLRRKVTLIDEMGKAEERRERVTGLARQVK